MRCKLIVYFFILALIGSACVPRVEGVCSCDWDDYAAVVGVDAAVAEVLHVSISGWTFFKDDVL
ncbi:hypothetical protein MAR_007893 [Mya arenaria]|uniref:Uncharacterized protein n=1 Tax=Mya arenaria TaxID=6604 RepID=A0ABY7DV56_MYAAR|nr:hypothetical protein MAR_007893 [Mya arenaria]